MTRTDGLGYIDSQRPDRPGGRRRPGRADRRRAPGAGRRTASGSRWSATGPRCSARPSSATACCSTRSRAIPGSSRSRCCRSTGPRTSTGPARSRPVSAASGSRAWSRRVSSLSAEPVVRAAARDRTPAVRPDQGLGLVGGDRRGDRGPGRPGHPDRQPLHDLGRGPGRRPALRAPPLRHELDGPFPGDRDGRRARSARSGSCSGADRRSVPSSRRSTRSSWRASRTTPSGRSWPATRPGCSACADAPVELPDIVRPPRAIDVHTHSGPMPWDVPDLGDDALMPSLVRDNATRYAVASNVLAIAADLEAGNRRDRRGVCPERRVSWATWWPTRTTSTPRATCSGAGATPRASSGSRSTRSGRTGTRAAGRSPTCSRSSPTTAGRSRSTTTGRTGTGTCCGSLVTIRSCRSSSPTPGSGSRTSRAPGSPPRPTTSTPRCRSSFAQLPTVREFIRTIPTERMLFGTDAPLLDPAFVLGTYQDAGSRRPTRPRSTGTTRPGCSGLD